MGTDSQQSILSPWAAGGPGGFSRSGLVRRAEPCKGHPPPVTLGSRWIPILYQRLEPQERLVLLRRDGFKMFPHPQNDFGAKFEKALAAPFDVSNETCCFQYMKMLRPRLPPRYNGVNRCRFARVACTKNHGPFRAGRHLVNRVATSPWVGPGYGSGF